MHFARRHRKGLADLEGFKLRVGGIVNVPESILPKILQPAEEIGPAFLCCAAHDLGIRPERIGRRQRQVGLATRELGQFKVLFGGAGDAVRRFVAPGRLQQKRIAVASVRPSLPKFAREALRLRARQRLLVLTDQCRVRALGQLKRLLQGEGGEFRTSTRRQRQMYGPIEPRLGYTGRGYARGEATDSSMDPAIPRFTAEFLAPRRTLWRGPRRVSRQVFSAAGISVGPCWLPAGRLIRSPPSQTPR